jgi:hypothetical protein
MTLGKFLWPLALGLAFLPAFLACAQLPDFLKDELLDKVIGSKNHPADKYGNYPDNLAGSLNEISTLQFQGERKDVLRQKVDALSKTPVFLRWFEIRLQDLWRANVKERESLEESLQKNQQVIGALQNTNGQLNKDLDDLNEQKKVLTNRITQLERENQEPQGNPPDIETPSNSSSWLGILSIILGLLLLGALAWLWIMKKKAPGTPGPREGDTRIISSQRQEIDSWKHKLQEKQADVDDAIRKVEERDDQLVAQQREINELKIKLL